MEIILNELGRHIGTRFAAVPLRNRIIEALRNKEIVIINCAGVESISSSFADEMYGKLWMEFKSEADPLEFLKNSVEFLNASPFTKESFMRTLKERIRSDSYLKESEE